MIKSNIKNRFVKGIFTIAFAITVFTGFAPLSTQAAQPRAYPFTLLKKVIGDGVRLRASAVNGTILELMYKNDLFWVDVINLEDQIANGWVHGQRDSTRTIGYVDAHFVGL